MKRTPALLLTLLIGAITPAVAKEPPPREALAGIDQTIEQALTTFQVPGISVSVVVGDEVVLAKGYGFRDVEKKLPMDADTLVPIASVTKQFTVGALGTLVRQGKLEWDKPVRDYLPDFRLHNEYATAHATARDLVTHRIGLPRHDAAWYGSDATREQLFQRLAHFEFSRDLRVRYQYNNLMYMTAGYLAGRLAQSTWEEIVQKAIFTPLGMKRSNFRIAAMHADANHALAYHLNDKREVVRTETESPEAVGPAGQINSSVAEMARYLRMMLNGGMFEGKRVLLEADVHAMMQPQVPIGPDPFPDLFGFRSYGMGFFVQIYRGIETAQHGGNLEGASALLVMVPSKKIGVMVLANRSHTRLRDALPYEIIDRLLGMESGGLLARHRQMEEKGFASEDAAKVAGVTDRKPNTKPAHPLTEYAGEYQHPGYGTVRIGLEQERLTLGYHKWSTPLEHWHFESFRAPADRLNELELTRVQFQTDLGGDVTSLAIPLELSVEPIVFAKHPPAEMRDRKFLEQLTGTYDAGGTPVEIVLREDNVLQHTVLGSIRELVPVRGTYFRFKDLAGTAVEFLRDAGGKVDRMVFYSAGGPSTIAPRLK